MAIAERLKCPAKWWYIGDESMVRTEHKIPTTYLSEDSQYTLANARLHPKECDCNGTGIDLKPVEALVVSIKELVAAMHDYAMDVEGEQPWKYREMMRKANDATAPFKEVSSPKEAFDELKALGIGHYFHEGFPER